MANVIKHKRGSGSDPGASDLVVGEVAIRTDVGKLFTKMDNGSVAEIAGGGSDIAINTLSSSSATGGGSATFNGSAYRFTLSAPPSVSAQQLLVSINGVIQKPVAGTGQPSEGFSVDGTDIILGDAPATGADFFILTFKSLGVSEPADDSVTSAKIVDGAIVNADINASAAIAGTKIYPDFGSQGIVTTGSLSTGQTVTLTGTNPKITFTDTNNNPDFEIYGSGGVFQIYDATNSATRFKVNSDGHVDVAGNLDVGAGLDVTGAITATGNLAIDTSAFFVNASNNFIGIGTATPTDSAGFGHCVDIKGGSSGTALYLRDSNNNTGQINFANSDLTIRTRQATPILFNVNNSERMRIDSSGRVLIGTTTEGISTGDDLTISGSGAVGMTIRSTNSDASNIFFSDGTSGDDEQRGILQYHHSDNSMRLFTNAAERMRIGSSGEVYIGTSNWPTGSLGKSAGRVMMGNEGSLTIWNETNSAGGGGTLKLACKEGSDATRVGFVNLVGGTENTSDRASFFKIQVSNSSGSGIERMRINSDGDVLIGRTATIDTSEVLGIKGPSGDHATFGITTDGTTNMGIIAFNDGGGNFMGQIRYQHSTDSMQFFTPGAERMRIDSSGNVGIGTSTIADDADHCKLAISGQSGTASGILIFQDTSNNEDGMIFADDGHLFIVADRANATSSSSIRFRVDGSSEKMRIDSSGDVIVGGTTRDAQQAITLAPNRHHGAGRITTNRANTTSVSIVWEMLNNGSQVGRIEHDHTSAGIVSGSDYRLKENDISISDGITRVKQLRPIRYNWKSEPSKTLDGFFAHEVSSIVPEAVSGEKDAVDSDGNIIMQGMVTERLVPLLTAALQEAIVRIEALEAG